MCSPASTAFSTPCFVRGDIVGDTLFYGRGAGKDATASAVLSDVADAALDLKNGTKVRVPPFVACTKGGRVMPMDEVVSRYYRPVRAWWTNPACWRKSPPFSRRQNRHLVRHPARRPRRRKRAADFHDPRRAERRDAQALEKIAKLPVVKGRPVMFRVENFE